MYVHFKLIRLGRTYSPEFHILQHTDGCPAAVLGALLMR